jgi:hypothetical protein
MNMLTSDQAKAVILAEKVRGYIAGRYNVDQIDQDCAHDLDLQDAWKAVAALCDKFINEA